MINLLGTPQDNFSYDELEQVSNAKDYRLKFAEYQGRLHIIMCNGYVLVILAYENDNTFTHCKAIYSNEQLEQFNPAIPTIKSDDNFFEITKVRTLDGEWSITFDTPLIAYIPKKGSKEFYCLESETKQTLALNLEPLTTEFHDYLITVENKKNYLKVTLQNTVSGVKCSLKHNDSIYKFADKALTVTNDYSKACMLIREIKGTLAQYELMALYYYNKRQKELNKLIEYIDVLNTDWGY